LIHNGLFKKKSFLKRWYEGCKNLTPLQMATAKRNGELGMLFGISLAAYYVCFKTGMWYFIFIFGFSFFLQLMGLLGTLKTITTLKSMEE